MGTMTATICFLFTFYAPCPGFLEKLDLPAQPAQFCFARKDAGRELDKVLTCNVMINNAWTAQ